MSQFQNMLKKKSKIVKEDIVPPYTPPKVKTFEGIIGPNVKVKKELKSGTQVFNFPFDFPDDEKGAIIICRLNEDEWIPYKTISKIIIEFV